jgi:hypothetical protein
MAYSPSRTSKSIQHVHSIYVSTFGILFLGTPHDDGNKAQLASVSRRMIGTLVPSKVVDTEGQLLDAMQEGSEVLQNITDMFVPLMKDFHIFIWEQEKTNMGVTQDYVRQSSPLDRDFRWRESEASVARSTCRAERLVPRDFERVVG